MKVKEVSALKKNMAAYVLGNVCKDSSKPHWNAIPVGRHKRDVVIGVLQTGDKK